MSKIYLICCIVLFSTWSGAQSEVWSHATAKTIAKGRVELPLLGVKKIGIRENLELRVQPILFFLDPHIGVKKYWTTKRGWDIGSVHRLNYPTMLLKQLSRAGTGGVLPENTTIPQILTTKNEVLLTKDIFENTFLTFRLGLEFAVISGKQDFPTIDFPFIYRRTAAHHGKSNQFAGLRFGWQINERFELLLSEDLYRIAKESHPYFDEASAVFSWNVSRKILLRAGVAFAGGNYPYGKDGYTVPFLDFVLGFGGKSKLSTWTN